MFAVLKKGLVTSVPALLLSMGLWVAAAAADERLGPMPGEKFVFNVHWLGLPSGKAVMEFNRVGTDGYSLESSLKSYGGMNFFFPIKDNFIVTGEDLPDRLLARSYIKNQNENGKKRIIGFSFDRANNKIMYRHDDERREIVHEGPINDYLSAVYSLRKRPIKTGDRFATNIVLEKQKIYQAELLVGEREGIATANGYHHTLPVNLIIKNSKRYTKPGDFVFWFTDDPRHMLVRIHINAKVGSIGMDLMEFEDGRGGSSADVEEEE